MTSPHETWSSHFAFLMASIGAAIGLGNIWRFPYVVGTSGGSAFIIVYLLAIVSIAVPVMMSEMVMGRQARMSAPGTMRVLAARVGASHHWVWVGRTGLAAMFLGASFYSVVAGWALAYVFMTAGGTFSEMASGEASSVFEAFLSNPVEMIFWQLTIIAITAFVVGNGIKNGIEKSIRVLMPTAALTTMIALLEGLTARAVESLDVNRKHSVVVLSIAIFLFGLFTLFSFNRWSDVHLLGFWTAFADMTPYDLIDFSVVNLLLPLGGMFFAIFSGWWLSKESTATELGLDPDGLTYTIWRILSRFVAPIAIAVMLIANLVV